LKNIKVVDFIDLHGQADITVRFEYANGGNRPTKVHYEASSPDGAKIRQSFNNHH
jgi:hypothetical protein